MPIPWLTVNKNLQNGVELMNSITLNKFNLLLNHIATSTNPEIFTVEEFKKLGDSLKLDESKIKLLVLSLKHILKQSAKVIIKPTVLQKQLTDDLGLNEEKANDFVKFWTDETKKDFDLEKQKKLENVSWELNITSSTSLIRKQANFGANIQLALEDMVDGTKENFLLSLDEEELSQLYNTIENIQTKLDSI